MVQVSLAPIFCLLKLNYKSYYYKYEKIFLNVARQDMPDISQPTQKSAVSVPALYSVITAGTGLEELSPPLLPSLR